MDLEYGLDFDAPDYGVIFSDDREIAETRERNFRYLVRQRSAVFSDDPQTIAAIYDKLVMIQKAVETGTEVQGLSEWESHEWTKVLWTAATPKLDDVYGTPVNVVILRFIASKCPSPRIDDFREVSYLLRLLACDVKDHDGELRFWLDLCPDVFRDEKTLSQLLVRYYATKSWKKIQALRDAGVTFPSFVSLVEFCLVNLGACYILESKACHLSVMEDLIQLAQNAGEDVGKSQLSDALLRSLQFDEEEFNSKFIDWSVPFPLPNNSAYDYAVSEGDSMDKDEAVSTEEKNNCPTLLSKQSSSLDQETPIPHNEPEPTASDDEDSFMDEDGDEHEVTSIDELNDRQAQPGWMRLLLSRGIAPPSTDIMNECWDNQSLMSLFLPMFYCFKRGVNINYPLVTEFNRRTNRGDDHYTIMPKVAIVLAKLIKFCGKDYPDVIIRELQAIAGEFPKLQSLQMLALSASYRMFMTRPENSTLPVLTSSNIVEMRKQTVAGELEVNGNVPAGFGEMFHKHLDSMYDEFKEEVRRALRSKVSGSDDELEAVDKFCGTF